MKLTKSTVAATLAALLIGGLAISPASAAVRSDLNSVTHGSIQEQANPSVRLRANSTAAAISQQ